MRSRCSHLDARDGPCVPSREAGLRFREGADEQVLAASGLGVADDPVHGAGVYVAGEAREARIDLLPSAIGVRRGQHGAGPLVWIETVSTSRRSAARAVNACTSVRGVAAAPWMNTRCPDATASRAASAPVVLSRSRAAQVTGLPLAGTGHATFAAGRGAATVPAAP